MKTKIDESLAGAESKAGMLDEAQSIYEEILLKYPKNLLAKEGLNFFASKTIHDRHT